MLGYLGIFSARAWTAKKVAAMVTDGGPFRDAEGVLQDGLPVWCGGISAPPSVAGLTFVNWASDRLRRRGRVYPNDLVVVDRMGPC